MNEILEKISNIGIVRVVVLDDASKAAKVAEALLDGGIDCAEVTFRTEAAEESIKNISKAFPDMLLGAGTVLTTAQVDRCQVYCYAGIQSGSCGLLCGKRSTDCSGMHGYERY